MATIMRFRLHTAGFFALLLVAAACAPTASPVGSSAPSASSGPVRGGTVVMAVPQDPPGFNPVLTTGYPEDLFGCMVYEGLVETDASGKYIPALAESWNVSTDGLTYTFQLRDTTWQDGQPLTADDVKYTFTNVSAKYGPLFRLAAPAIDSVDASGPRTVAVHLKYAFAPFMAVLPCMQGGAILPKHLFDGTDPLKNPATLTKPVGTGPFALSEFVPGDHLTFGRNPKYWMAGKPYLDQIKARVMPDASARSLAIQSGDIKLEGGPKLEMPKS